MKQAVFGVKIGRKICPLVSGFPEFTFDYDAGLLIPDPGYALNELALPVAVYGPAPAYQVVVSPRAIHEAVAAVISR
jgi:hypothetical protein